MARLERTDATVENALIGSGQSRYRSQSGGYHYKTSHYPDITYRYTVDGQTYVNNQYAQRPALINREFIIQRILNKYPVGSTVIVYYNPDNPQESYLQKGYGSEVKLILLLAALFVIAILAINVIVLIARS